MLHLIAPLLMPALVGLALLLALGGLLWPWLWWPLVVLVAPLILLGVWDRSQKRHSILRNYHRVRAQEAVQTEGAVRRQARAAPFDQCFQVQIASLPTVGVPTNGDS